MATEVPERADVVVIGGGVIGCSIAFHLAEAGVRRVLLVEAGHLGSGSTSKAAGGVRASFTDPVNIAMGLRGLQAYARFPQQFGHEVDFSQRGYLYALSTPESASAFAEAVELQNSLGVPSRMVTPEQAVALAPNLNPDGLLAALWSPGDARATPEGVVMGYAKEARRRGALLMQNVSVLGIDTGPGGIQGVHTTAGFVRTATVVCAAGPWSGQVAALAGLDLPVTPHRRVIAFTGPVKGGAPSGPLTVEFPSTLYFHPEGNRYAIGWSDLDEPAGFDTGVRLNDWLERVGPHIERRAPKLFEYGIASAWAGLYENTPDHNQIIGRSADLPGFLYATGFSGHGFMMGPATGEIIRDLYLGREPEFDISSLDVRRFDDQRVAVASERNII